MSTRLRGNAPRRSGPYPLGEIPREVVVGIGRKIVHRLAVGIADIQGDDFGTIFAAAIQGQHRGKPLGIADVEFEDCAWSVKTVKSPRPFEQKMVRLISGRNPPGFAHGITAPLADLERTGRSILEIWNARIDEALHSFDDLRILVMIRNIATREFVLTEHEAHRFQPREFEWRLNPRNNLEGFDRITGAQRFVWQPGGSQFTILHPVPASAQKFRIKKRPMIFGEAEVMNTVGYDDSWIETFEPSVGK
jgi:hypothetical protein